MSLRPDDLPDWMRPRSRRIDQGLVFILIIAVCATLGLVFRPGLPMNAPAEQYLLRTEQTTRFFKEGILYSRWAADFHNGLGSPIFNVLAPLPHTLTGLYTFITDTPALNTVKDALVVAWVALVGGLYLAIRGILPTGAVAGTLTGLVVTCPLFVSGALAEISSLAFLVWLLYAIEKLAHQSTRRWFGGVVFLAAGWSLCDNRLTLLGLPVVLILWACSPNRCRVGSAFLFAVILTAFYTIPSVIERNTLILVSAEGTERIFESIPATHALIVPGVICLALCVAWIGQQRWIGRLLTVGLAAIGVSATIIGATWGDYTLLARTESESGLYGSLQGEYLLPLTAYDSGTPPVFLRVQLTQPGRPDYPILLGVVPVERTTLTTRYTVNLGGNQLTRLDRYAYPGWYVVSEGETLTPNSDSSGFLIYNVSAQTRELLVIFGTTPPRLIGEGLSLIGGIGIGWRLRPQRTRPAKARSILATSSAGPKGLVI
jgi:hypothetical protein